VVRGGRGVGVGEGEGRGKGGGEWEEGGTKEGCRGGREGGGVGG